MKPRSQSSPAAVAKRSATRRARLDPLVRQMHADYMAGLSLHQVGDKYGRDRRSVREFFVKRGLFVRTYRKVARRPDGTFVPLKPASRAKLEQFIRTATRVYIPHWLEREWRNWPLERRIWFVRRLWRGVDKRRPGRAIPTGPYSANVEFFDYGSLKAHSIAEKMNKGRSSRYSLIRVFAGSRGVIYKGGLWYWNHFSYQLGPWNAVTGRPNLNQHIYQEHYGPIPASHVVSFRDGNPNNLAPKNLYLRTRNDVCRANHARWLRDKSRAATKLLLNRHRKDSHAAPGHEQPLVRLREDHQRRTAEKIKAWGKRTRERRRARAEAPIAGAHARGEEAPAR